MALPGQATWLHERPFEYYHSFPIRLLFLSLALNLQQWLTVWDCHSSQGSRLLAGLAQPAQQWDRASGDAASFLKSEHASRERPVFD